MNPVTTRLNEVVGTIRATYYKQSERNILVNIQNSKGYEGLIESCKDGYRLRKYTPRTCWRLMGFSDKDYDKARLVNSDTQLYRQAGNSIALNVLIAIFGQMFT